MKQSQAREHTWATHQRLHGGAWGDKGIRALKERRLERARHVSTLGHSSGAACHSGD